MFIDLPKVINILGHSRFLAKLKACSFEEIELHWLTNELFERSQVVAINEKVSNSCPVYCGVPKGPILAPILV